MRLTALERGARVLTTLAVAASAAAAVAFALGLMRVRPLIYGEAEVLHEASRIREGLRLYTDPLAGAFDYGPVPTRCFVVYPPLWSWMLSHVPAGAAATFARAACSLSWFGALAWVAARARPGCRRAAWLAAGTAGGIYVIAIFATAGRPDSIAIALAAVALARAARRGEVDAWTGALLALAAWVKPNVLGIGAGLALFALAREPRRVWRFALGAAAVSAPIAAVLHAVSRGAWWQHLVESTGQPLLFDTWWANVGPRAMFIAPAAATSWLAWRGRGDPGVRAASSAWAASLVWSLVSLAKAGASSNYWMEPAVAAVVVAANAPVPALSASWRTAGWWAIAGAAVWLAIPNVGGVLEAFQREPPRAALLARARADCGARPGEVVVADTPGDEMTLNGRVIAPGFQTLFLVIDGRMPERTWADDMRRPQVVCAVEREGRVFHILPEVAAAFDVRFVEIERVEDWRLYSLRHREGR